MFTFIRVRRRGGTSGTRFGCGFGNLVVSSPGVGAGGAAGLDAAFVLNFFGIVKEGLEEAFFGPFVFAHEDGGGGGGDVEDVYDCVLG